MIPVDLKSTPQGILLPVHVHAGARRNQIHGVHDGRLKISVTQVAEQGKANLEIQRLLAESLGIAKAQVELQSGKTSSRKVFRLTGISLPQLEQCIVKVIDGGKSSMDHHQP
ncbi:DUF167 domain-containing protein [Planctomicrobium sp. SH661]|uniref:DUF167 domain-containing protein n=1 Tax=Planctomicrobium sp. SH661 TaxID=3448124 RepID=UPI003F5BFD7E